jgi:hypothetical protein
MTKAWSLDIQISHTGASKLRNAAIGDGDIQALYPIAPRHRFAIGDLASIWRSISGPRIAWSFWMTTNERSGVPHEIQDRR